MSRPKGLPKTGGRAKGVKNKKTELRELRIREATRAAALEPDDIRKLSPLEVMRRIMFNRYEAGDHVGALEAAQACAPYVHPKLNASDVRVRHELSDRSDAELAEEARALAAKMRAVGLTIDAEPVPQTRGQRS
jgi:hypothetical protein